MSEETKNLMDGLNIEEAINDNINDEAETTLTEEEKVKEAEERLKTRIVEPFDIFGDTSITGRQEATRDMFPWAIWDYAEDVGKRPGLNPGPIAAGCLVAAAGAIREGWRIQPKRNDPDWTEPSILWVGITGSSGAKKTHSMKSSVSPLSLIQKNSMKDAEINAKHFKRTKAEHNERMKAWRKECQKIMKQEESNSVELPEMPEAPESPTYERFIIEDTTTEAVMKVCSQNPSGIIQMRDELTGWIKGFDKYSGGSGGDRAFYLECWNNGSMMKDRASYDDGPMIVKNLGVSIFGGIQDDVIKKEFSATAHDGFLARFLFVKADILPGQDIAPDAEKAKAYFNLIGKLAALKVNEKEGETGVITMSREAAAIREDIEAMALALNDHPTIRKGLSDHINKWPAIFSRLCLVFHMLKCVDKGKNPQFIHVQEDTAQRAYDLLTKYFLPEAARIYNEVMQGGDEQEQHARWIAGHILAHKKERISVYEIRRAFSSIKNDDFALKKATATLELMAWLTVDTQNRDFSKMKWRVNPRVHGMFAEQAELEANRRSEIVQKIRDGADAMKKLQNNVK